MRDLNDLHFFCAVVAHKGYAAAARALQVSKSGLSVRVARLEQRLGVRLIERSTRRFRATDIGQALYEQCQAALADIEAAEASAELSRAEPAGTVRVSCPPGLAEPVMADLVTAFMGSHPLVRIEMMVVNRRVDVIEERVDIALRVRTKLDSDVQLISRTLGESRRVLVASPAFFDQWGVIDAPDQIATVGTLSLAENIRLDEWTLKATDGRTAVVRHTPRLACENFGIVKRAAIAGLGIALLPNHACASELRNGLLLPVLPKWSCDNAIVHIIFTARRGLISPVRAFIDYLVKAFPAVYASWMETSDEMTFG